MALADLFNGIADAIREKDGTTADIVANTFPERIRDLPASGGIQLTSIEITTPPDKVVYTVGQIFNPTGMVVTAHYSNDLSVVVNHEKLVFTPNGALDESVTSVTVSFTDSGNTATAQQEVSVFDAHIYGVTWDGTATTKWTRTDESALFTDPVPYVAGATEYGSPFDELQPWAGMVKEERTGGTMVAIPKFWYEMTQIGPAISIKISDKPVFGFAPSPAHMDKGDGKGERDVVYIGRYHCAEDFKSKTGVLPRGQTTFSVFRSGIHALGNNIWQFDFAMLVTLWILYLVEYADWNSQAAIGKGCGNGSSVENTGLTDSMPYHTGTIRNSRFEYGTGLQYRNIEGLWDNVLIWCDGCYNYNGLRIVLNPNNFYNIRDGILVGMPCADYPSEFRISDSSGFSMFFGSKNGGNSATYSCDKWWYDNDSYLMTGSYYEQTDMRGLFYVSYAYGSYTHIGVGSRIQELP